MIVAVDTSQRMQCDAEGTYYDPGTYTMTGAAFEAALGLQSGEALKTYRRKYTDLRHVDPAATTAPSIWPARSSAVGDQESAYSTFFERTRLALARRSVTRAITDNLSSARFALIKTRQGSVTLPATGNEHTAVVRDAVAADRRPTRRPANGTSRARRSAPTTAAQTTTGLLTAATASGANATIVATLAKNIGTAGALLPGGNDDVGVVDSPVGLMLDDARAHAASLISADASLGGCRNTIVVLIVGGGEGTISPQDLAAKAATFLNVNTRRVPIYVVALFPERPSEASLQAIATASGGQYFEMTEAMVSADDGRRSGAGDRARDQHRGAARATCRRRPSTPRRRRSIRSGSPPSGR